MLFEGPCSRDTAHRRRQPQLPARAPDFASQARLWQSSLLPCAFNKLFGNLFQVSRYRSKEFRSRFPRKVPVNCEGFRLKLRSKIYFRHPAGMELLLHRITRCREMARKVFPPVAPLREPMKDRPSIVIAIIRPG